MHNLLPFILVRGAAGVGAAPVSGAKAGAGILFLTRVDFVFSGVDVDSTSLNCIGDNFIIG